MSAARGPDRDDPVAILRWPDEADARHALAEAGLPRLLVVADDDPPPLVWDDREDWIREGAGEVETASRAARLARSPTADPDRTARPVLDADGVLHASGGRIVVIPPLEAAILGALLDRTNRVVRREDLHRAAWPSGDRDGRAVDGRVRGLRRRTEGMGITIHTVRGVGYLLEVDGT
ncbi:MAG TPA: helix-turn-helix domain-containing protein [Iamia sp.]